CKFTGQWGGAGPRGCRAAWLSFANAPLSNRAMGFRLEEPSSFSLSRSALQPGCVAMQKKDYFCLYDADVWFFEFIRLEKTKKMRMALILPKPNDRVK
ncbi:hypothetical protein, partial [Pseudomonas izuensis]|uniref:hypothetical protein n=1 Tax=Pseudomonas izuensis TaxID=2684212 RepID=UPI001C49923D